MTDQQHGLNDMGEWYDAGFSPVPEVNPATGLPMVNNNIGGVDVGGTPYGTDSYHPWSS